jgi:hypothetical protein
VRAILAAAETLERLEAVLAEQRIDPQAVYLEFIPGPEDELNFSPETPQTEA